MNKYFYAVVDKNGQLCAGATDHEQAREQKRHVEEYPLHHEVQTFKILRFDISEAKVVR